MGLFHKDLATRLFLSGLAGFFLCSCTPRAIVSPETGMAPAAVHLTNVPFYPNTSDQCGPSSLTSVLNYWGKNIQPEEVKQKIYIPSLKGTLPMDMRPALTQYGLNGAVFAGSFEDIKDELRKGRPVIAYLDFGTKKHPIGHFLVVTGFDDNKKGLYVHSGAAQNKFASYRRFNRGWKDTDHWMLTVDPSAPAPEPIASERRRPVIETIVTPEEHVLLGTIYESQHKPKEAAIEYNRALSENSRYEPALMALGNLAYEANDYKTAEKYYRKVLKRNPSHGGANNNLAMIYLAQGKKLARAEELATKAAATEYKPYAEDTLKQIREKN